MENAYLAQYGMRRLTGTLYKTGTAPIWAPVKIAANVSGNWQTRQVPVLQRTYLQLAEPILPGGSGIDHMTGTPFFIKCFSCVGYLLTHGFSLSTQGAQRRKLTLKAHGERGMLDMEMQQHPQSPFWRSAAGLAAIGFGGVAAFFLFTEHRAHLYGILPWLLLLCCPVMMLFMHHGHDRHEDHDHTIGDRESSKQGTEKPL